jgi:hypothetical protein
MAKLEGLREGRGERGMEAPYTASSLEDKDGISASTLK